MDDFKECNVLVVGGAGFVGSNLVKMLLNYNANQITIVDNLLSAEEVNIPKDNRVVFIKGSIADDQILHQLKDEYNYIFHLATYHGNQSSIHNPLLDHENNTLTTLKLMNYVKNFKNIKKLVYSSAGCSVAEKTFSNTKATTEDAPISIIQDSPYSISKVIGEFYSVYFYNQHGLPTVRARFQNVYGPGEILGAGEWRGTPATVWRNVTPVFIYKALNSQALPIENKGIASRDFIFVNDICKGLISCALKGKPGDVYNLATEKETTIIELATMINKLSDNAANIEYLPKRSWDHSGKRYGSAKKANQELDFEASVPLEEGLKMTIAWTKENLSVIQSCINKHKRMLT